MVAKKTKKSVARKAEPGTPVKPTTVTQMVVEVEDEEGEGSTPLKTIEKDTQAVEEAAQKLEEDIEKELETEGEKKSTAETQALIEAAKTRITEPEEKRKEVVKEFFKPESREVTPEIATYQGKGGSKATLIWAFIIVAVALLTSGGLLVALRGKSSVKVPFLVTATPSPTPQALPTPTPTPAVSRADLKLEVLNGGGVPGAGAKMKEFLEGKGYTVSSVGNTESYTYENTVILVKPDKEAYLALLKSDLKDSYVIGTAAASLSADASTGARVIVGKE